jgi:hypothetical protein
LSQLGHRPLPLDHDELASISSTESATEQVAERRAMAFRIVWPGRFGKESSQLIDELERARIIADSLASRKKEKVYVIDAANRRVVYLTPKKSETAPT